MSLVVFFLLGQTKFDLFLTSLRYPSSFYHILCILTYLAGTYTIYHSILTSLLIIYHTLISVRISCVLKSSLGYQFWSCRLSSNNKVTTRVKTLRYKYHLSFIWTIFLGGWVNWGSHRWQWGECECAIDTHGRQLSIGVNHWLQYISGVIPDSLLHIYILISLSYVSTCTNFRAIIVPSIPIIASTYRFSFCPVFYTCSVTTSWLWYSYIIIIFLACLWCIGLL